MTVKWLCSGGSKIFFREPLIFLFERHENVHSVEVMIHTHTVSQFPHLDVFMIADPLNRSDAPYWSSIESVIVSSCRGCVMDPGARASRRLYARLREIATPAEFRLSVGGSNTMQCKLVLFAAVVTDEKRIQLL